MGDIEELRDRISTITRSMMMLLKERNDIVKDIGQIKKMTGQATLNEGQEMTLRENTLVTAKEIGLDRNIASRFLNFILNESFKIQSDDKNTHLAIFRRAKALEEQGRKIIHMEVGQPDFTPPDIVKESLGQAYDKGFFRYGPATGIPEFRQALAAHTSNSLGVSIRPENILPSPGGRFAVFSAITALLVPGDEIIVIEPAWPAYRDCALHAGVKVRTIRTTLEEDWVPSTDQIRKTVSPNTKMIVLNYPNNPTGKILSSRTQDEIMDIASKYKLYVLSDEIYSQYAYSDWRSVLSYQYDKSIIVQSFSKSHAMTGFRIGYAVSSEEIINKMTRLAELCLTNVSEPVQYAAMKALESDTTSNSNTIKKRLEALAREAERLGMEFVSPDGAMYLYARVPQEGFDGAEFADRLLDMGVAVAPGVGFGDYPDFIRISACQNENILMQGMNILDRELRQVK